MILSQPNLKTEKVEFNEMCYKFQLEINLAPTSNCEVFSVDVKY